MMNDDLLVRYLEGNCSDFDKVEVVKWIDESPEHLIEYMSLRKAHDISIWRATEEKHAGTRKISIGTIIKETLKIAAVIAVTLLAYRFVVTRDVSSDMMAVMDKEVYVQESEQILKVPAGQRVEIILEDGTNVWLNAGSTLKFPGHFSGNTREVELDGEGFFEVASNVDNPFIVKTSKYDVRVTGTTFNLMAYSSNSIFETMLLEGSVEIVDCKNDVTTILGVNEFAYVQDGEMLISDSIDAMHLLWREGIISFNDEKFGDLLGKLELYFDVSIDVRNGAILNKKYSGKFRTKDGIEHILKVFQLRHHFIYEIDADNNIITIK